MVTAPLAIVAALTLLTVVAPTPTASTDEIRPPPPPAAAVRGEEHYFWVAASAGEGRWTDTSVQDAEPSSSVGLALAWRLRTAHTLRFDLGLERYRRTLVSARIDPLTGQGSRADTAERRWTAELGYAFDLLWLARPGPWSLELLVHGGVQVFDNPVVKGTVLPLGGGLRLSRRVGETARLFAEGTVAGFVGARDPGADSIAGALRSSLRTRAGAVFSPAPALELELAWRGELISLSRGSRQDDAVIIQATFGL